MLSVSSNQSPKPPTQNNWASWLLIGIALAAVIALAVFNSTGKAQRATRKPNCFEPAASEIDSKKR